MDLMPGRTLAPDQIANLLQEARARTLLLVAPLEAGDLRRQHDPLMSPIIWDLGHIAHFEEVWLLERLAGSGGSEGLRGMYDPFRNPRAVRDTLPLPELGEALAYLGSVRRRVLDGLRCATESAGGPLTRESFVYRMVLQHEYQHDETILQTLQLKQGQPYPAPRGAEVPPAPAERPETGRMVRFPGGEVRLGTDDRSEAYDNERPGHTVTLAPFWIDAAPATNGAFLAFMEDGGYRRPEFWDPRGLAFVREEGIEAPRSWIRTDGGWSERFFDRVRPVDPERPVCHVSFWEADAFARWAGKRLPTEAEWEAAATWDPHAGRSTRFPWGDDPATPERANVDQLTFDTAPVWSYPGNVSPVGCYGMIGDVWEWTASDFRPYPGYATFPYPEYSEVFFGDEYKVLRGGSFATRGGAVRGTFRNWDYPIRRQIFAGFRCARDAEALP
ncbi:MAG: ergothioneine biosynthesis protein EgtB [Longimicrobiales bacterium]|nr:ergothioneine biosynthesis protein EgtB [Longimicrobiales bacterium]